MFSQRLDWLESNGCLGYLRGGLRGVEKETLRVDPRGHISQRPHPRALGSALTHPVITTDYAEALLELVTPPTAGNWQVLQGLADVHAYLHRRLDGELLWPMSMPCLFEGDDSIRIANYGHSNAGMLRTVYRRGLGKRYGRAMQAIAGVHFNYSLPGDLWPVMRDSEDSAADLQDFRSQRYMDLVRNYQRLAWLVVYLFGASPAFSKSFLGDTAPAFVAPFDANTWYAPHATSLRMSDLGYQNRTQARLQISTNSLADYLAGLTAAISTPEPRYEALGVVNEDGDYQQLNAHVLQIENEYYSTIRPKPSAEFPRTTIGLRRGGVHYVEIRTTDLSPADPVGLSQVTMRFLESLLIYCLLADSPPIGEAELAEINARSIAVAREGRRPGLEVPHRGALRSLRRIAEPVFADLERVADCLDGGGGDAYRLSVAEQWQCLLNPELTPSARLLAAMRAAGAGFSEYALETARSHHEYFLSGLLEPRVEAEFRSQCEQSLAQAAALEVSDTMRFPEYLDRFMANI